MLSFEVVLADGSIVQASGNSNPDLYKALRGGGANFGIVTDLELMVYPYQGMWGGGMKWSWEHGDAVIDAFIKYGEDNVSNVDASVILGVVNYQGEWVWHADVEHLKPTQLSECPSLRPFLDIPTAVDFTAKASQIDRTDGIMGNYPAGSFNGYWTFCTQVDRRIIRFFMDTWQEEIDPILHLEGLERSALADINFVSQNIVDAMVRNGGNALGLCGKGPLLVYLMEPYWMNAADSPRVWEALSRTAMKTHAEAKRLGVYHEYVYLNYANPFQDVYASYGSEAKEFMASTSKKYDPDGVFQWQRRAGWHLHGPLVPFATVTRQSSSKI